MFFGKSYTLRFINVNFDIHKERPFNIHDSLKLSLSFCKDKAASWVFIDLNILASSANSKILEFAYREGNVINK